MDPPQIPHRPVRRADDELRRRAAELRETMRTRRSVRHFSREPVPREVVEACVEIAASAPSGAHQQPWTWVLVGDEQRKAQIRAAAEEEERAFYAGRVPEQWLEAVAPLGTDASKPHLTDAPWLLVLLRHRWQPDGEGGRVRTYYSKESCGIAAGFLLMALHQVGLAALTHTPAPMAFLRDLLGRPEHEEPELLIPVGRPHPAATVPDLTRRPLWDVLLRPPPEPPGH